MHITRINIQNFRKLHKCSIDFTENSTIFVGANNSGKTSAYEAIILFLQNEKISIKDFTLSNWINFEEKIDKPWRDAIENSKPELKLTLDLYQEYFPFIDVWLEVPEEELHLVINILPTLEWEQDQKIGLRLIYQPKNQETLFECFKSDYSTVYNHNNDKSKSFKQFPTSLHDFLDKNINKYFSIKTYILDPSSYSNTYGKIENDIEPLDNYPLKDLIKVDKIDAKRDTTDSSSQGNTRSISQQLKKYAAIMGSKADLKKTDYELNVLSDIEDMNNTFDIILNKQFEEPIEKITKNLHYPNFSNPSIKLVNNLKPVDSLEKGTNILFDNFGSENNKLLLLPETYNGLGYQNMLYLQIQLLQFAKERELSENNYPLHLVLVEEPEAHLHVQMQETFVNNAYEIIEQGKSTQLVVSTHSSHIANTVEFTQLRYFKRIKRNYSNKTNSVPNSEIINLSSDFNLKEDAARFAKRYLKLTHSDLLFADGAILVEGPSEKLLLPKFIEQINDLKNKYITVLEVGGAYAHMLKILLNKLGIPVLIITDIDCYSKDKHEVKEKTTNSTIKNFFNGSTIKDLQNKTHADKVFDNIRIAYQTKINGIQPNTFEDALLLSNLDFFKNITPNHTGLLKKFIDIAKEFDGKIKTDYHKNILLAINTARKANLALDLLFLENLDDLKTPEYIAEGLSLLAKKFDGPKL